MAKTIKNEDLRLNIIVNGDAGRKGILDTQKAISDLEGKLKSLKSAEGDHSGEIAATNKKLTEAKARYAELQKQISLDNKTISELKTHIRATRAALEKAVPGTENWERLNAELSVSKKRFQELAGQTGNVKVAISGFVGIYGGLSAAFNNIMDAISSLSGYFEKARQSWLDYDEAMVDAMKTTGLTRDEMDSLSESLRKMDTRTAQNELLSLVRVGGKLGISGKEDLMEFVSAADKINVALKEDLGGDAEAAIGQIGKLVDIFQLKGEMGLERAMLSVGSAINELGAASTANEGYIVDFTNRLAGIAPNANISIDKILGLASTLDANGQAAETAATAIGQTITAMFKKTETFAQIAKMPFEEFKNLLEQDVNQALVKVLEGMKGDRGLFDIVDAMGEMHLNGQRATTVLGALANNIDMLKNQQEKANEAFSAGTSLTDEFNKKNESATAVLEKSKKALEEQWVVIGEQLTPAMNLVTVGSAKLLSLIGQIITYAAKYKIVLGGLALAYAALNKVEAIRLTLSKLNSAAFKQRKADLAIEATLLQGSTKATMLNCAAQNLLVGNLRAAGTAFKAFSKALLANPIGLIAAGITAAIGVLIHFISKSREATKGLRELNRQTTDSLSGFVQAKEKIDRERQSLEQLKEAAMKAAVGSNERKEAIRRINELYGDYLPNLLSEKISNTELETALTNVNTQLEKKILLQAKENELQTVLQHKTDTVKAALEGYGKLFEKINGRKMNAAEITSMTETLSRTYDNVQKDDSELNYRYDAKQTFRQSGMQFYRDRQSLGLSPQTQGQKSLLWNLNDEFVKAIRTGRELKAVVDGLYGTETPSGGTAAGGGIAGTGSTSTGGSDSGKWSLSKDEQHQKQLLDLKKKYLSGGYKDEQEYNAAVLQLEIDTLKQRLSNTALSAEERLSAEQTLNDKLIEQKKQAARQEESLEKKKEDLQKQGLKVLREVNDDKIAEENARYEEERAMFEGNAAALEAVERKHRARLSKIHLDALDKQMKDAKAANELELLAARNRQAEEVRNFSGSAAEKERMQRRHNEELARINQNYALKLKSILDTLTSADGNIDIRFSGLSDSDLTALKTRIQEIISIMNESASPSGGDGQESGQGFRTFGGGAFGVSAEQWQEFFDNLEAGKVGAQELGTAIQAIGGAASEAMNLASLAASRQTAIENNQLKEYKKSQDQKRKALEKRVNAGLMTEAQYNAEIEAMDAEYDAKQEELQLKQAKRQKQLQLTQAIINTALGVTAALNNPFPLNIVLAAINGAMGAAQIALIASTPITTGAEEGGMQFVERKQDGKTFKARLSPDKRGLIGQPTLLVGENGPEYVIPNDGIENPTLAPLLGTIEQARRAGTLKNLNFNAVYPVPAIGRESGGYTTPVTQTPIQDTTLTPPSSVSYDKELKELLVRLEERLSQPIQASVSMLGRNGIVENISKYEELKKRGQLR